MSRKFAAPARVRLSAEPLEGRAVPATFTVTTLADAGAGSLRAAVALANAQSDADTIVFDPAVRGGMLTLKTVDPTTAAATDAESLAGLSALVVRSPVTIAGTGETVTRTTSGTPFRLFQVTAAGQLTLENLTLTGGVAQGAQGGFGGGAGGFGGAVFNQGLLTLRGCTLTGNQAVGGGVISSATGGGGLLTSNFDVGGNPNGGAAGTNGATGTTGGGTGNPNGGPGGTGGTGGAGGFGGGGGVGGIGGTGGSTSGLNVGGTGGTGGTGGAGGFGGGGGRGGTGGTGGAAFGGGFPGSGGVGGVGGAGGFGGGGGAGGFGGGDGSGTGTAAAGAGGAGGPGGFGGHGAAGVGGGGSGFGGAVFNLGGAVTIVDTTITGNTAQGGGASGGAQHGGGFGGGIFNLNGSVTLTHATVADNAVVAGTGGAAFPADGPELYTASVNVGADTPTRVALVTVANSVISHSAGGNAVFNYKDAGSTGTSTISAAGPNIRFGTLTSNGADTGTPFTVAAPSLGPLADNGGPTRTRAPTAVSPAIDAGAAAAAAGLTKDQRGRPRTSGRAPDLGAVEVQVPAPLDVAGAADGSVVVFRPDAAGRFPPTPASTLAPFGSVAAALRVAAGDVNGDGTADVVAVTGPGSPLRVAVVSGADNATLLVAPFDPFGGDFLGGGFVAAADLDGDGKAEFVVTPDQGGGPRVTVFSFTSAGAAPTQRANFFGIDDANFRGGARAALGDVDRDGTPDVVVSAGFTGGPRTAIFRGPSVLAGSPTRLVGDFFAFPGSDATTLRNGSFVAAGDVTGDGFADLIFGGGPGGAPRVFILSGAVVAAGDVAGAQAAPVANFFVAGNAADRGGVRVAATDSDADGRADLAVGSGEGNPARARVYLAKDFAGPGEPATFQDLTAFGGAALPGGVFVG